MDNARRPQIVLAVSSSVAVLLFVLDLFTPLGAAGGLPYLTLVLIALLARMRWAMLGFATLATVLIVAGYYLAPPPSSLAAMPMLNRTLAVLAIWSTALISFWHLRSLATLTPLVDRDQLTGLYNRHYFGAEARRQMSAWRRYGNPLSLIMLDIDHFKRINDRHGHLAGDEVLKALANTLQECTRDIDTACRYGGEEFVVLLPFTNQSGALAKAHQIRRAIASLTVHWQKEHLSFRVSMGVAELADDSWEVADLIDAADHALYQAKNEGRDRICLAPITGTPGPRANTKDGLTPPA
ncbi:MAG: GGDEF domain-containing protein [Pseudomonadota bacterium]|nr:MAG: GGDEF domain-containing protein [Pseudomonadota bacterium]